MSDNAQSAMDFHYGALQKLYDKALRNEEEISAALTQLAALSTSLADTAAHLPGRLTAAVSTATTDATKEATASIIADHKAAISSAQSACQAFDRSARRASIWAFGTGAAIFALVMLLAGGALYFYVPTRAEINALLDEEAKLHASIKHLKDQGALAKITTCEDGTKKRLCVKISAADRDKSWGDYNYKIIDGY